MELADKIIALMCFTTFIFPFNDSYSSAMFYSLFNDLHSNLQYDYSPHMRALFHFQVYFFSYYHTLDKEFHIHFYHPPPS